MLQEARRGKGNVPAGQAIWTMGHHTTLFPLIFLYIQVLSTKVLQVRTSVFAIWQNFKIQS